METMGPGNSGFSALRARSPEASPAVTSRAQCCLVHRIPARVHFAPAQQPKKKL